MRVLSFSAKAGHGKDTASRLAAEVAREEFGLNVARFAFAWPLKSRVYSEGMLGGDLLWNDIIVKAPAVRKLLQEVGTEKGRNVYGEEFWTLQAEGFLRLMQETDPTLDLVIISDCRFPNEVDFVKLGGRSSLSVIKEIAADSALDPDDEEYYRLTTEKYIAALNAKQGLALWINSDRPTLTGDAAKHPSETALDELHNSPNGFDGYIQNKLVHSFDEIKSQLRPFIRTLALR